MPIENKNATKPDLIAILEGLIKAKIKFILVGGLAAVVQGAPITTIDVDIVHEQSFENITKLLNFLKSINTFYRRPDDKLIQPTYNDLSAKGHSLFTTNLGPLDVLSIIEQGKSYNDLIKDTVEIKFRGKIIKVLSLKTLIELKKESNYLKDKQRILILEETLQQQEYF